MREVEIILLMHQSQRKQPPQLPSSSGLDRRKSGLLHFESAQSIAQPAPAANAVDHNAP